MEQEVADAVGYTVRPPPEILMRDLREGGMDLREILVAEILTRLIDEAGGEIGHAALLR
jgi:hypothetical protein